MSTHPSEPEKSPDWLKWGLLAAIIAGAIILGISYKLKQPAGSEESGSTTTKLAGAGGGDSKALTAFSSRTAGPRESSVWDVDGNPAKQFNGLRRTRSAAARAAGAASASTAEQLLAQLADDLGGAPLDEEGAARLNQLFEKLATLGKAAIPVIRAYLADGLDVNYDSLEGGAAVSYPSLRIGLLDTLRQIGGSEAVQLMGQSLGNANNPLEIALLANELESQAPGQYREYAISVGRHVLARGTSGGWDSGPLFEMLQTFGDATLAAEIASQVQRYNYYATMALAGLPDGAGIPELIRLSQDPAVTAMGKGDYALRMLAQVSSQYPAAGATLVQQARANQIPAGAWPTVAGALAGAYLQYGNPVYSASTSPQSWSTAQIQQQIALVDQLLAVTGDPAGMQSLQSARATLVNRLAR